MKQNPIQEALNVIMECLNHCPTPSILEQLHKDLKMLTKLLEQRIKAL